MLSFFLTVFFTSFAQAATTVNGTISQNTTWTTAGSPYVINGSVTVASGVTLTIDPSVVVKGRGAYDALTVRGTLNATDAIFTSYKDDTYGGDTNGDGSASAPAAGDWKNINFINGGGTLSGCLILWGGSTSTSGNLIGTSGAAANVTITGSTIRQSKGYGLNVAADTGAISVSSSTFANNGSDGIYSTKPLSSISGNSFTGNNGKAVRLPAIIGAGVFNNTYSGNKINAMYVTGHVTQNTSWPASNSPYVVEGISGGNFHFDVTAGNSLDIEAGTTVKMFAGLSGQTHTNTTRSLLVYGTLNATNTVFTSFFDDIHGGDTNNDGWASGPLPGDWYDIKFYASGGGALDGSTLAYGGGATSGNLLTIAGASPTLTGCTLSNSKNRGMYVSAGNPSISSTTFSSNGNNGLESIVPLSTVWANIFSDNNGTAVILPANLGVNVAGNSYAGNKINGMYLTGHVTQNTAWPGSNSPYVLEGVWGSAANTNIETGVTLTVGDGAVIKPLAAYSNGQHANTAHNLVVKGTLNASSTVFTSFFDDTYGGDTNGDGTVTSPLPGDWYQLQFSDGSNGSIGGSLISYGGGGPSEAQLFISGSSPAINGSFISNSNAKGIYVYSGSPSLSSNLVSNNGGDGLVANTTPGALTDNIFVDNSGIAARIPATTGALVSGNSAAGNQGDGIFLSGDVTANSTWGASGTPYVLEGIRGYPGPAVTSIATGVTLDIGPGSIVKYKADLIGSTHVNTDHLLSINGSINASNTVFTSYFDDAHGGDTDGDGGATLPVPGDWQDIEFSAGSAGNIDGCQVSYGGGSSNAEVTVSGSSPSIANSTISDSASRGLYVSGSSGSPSVSGNTITGNVGAGLESELIMSVLSGNSFTGNGGVAARIPATTGTGVFNNTYSGNAGDGLFLSDDVTANSTWPASSSPYVLEGKDTVPGASVDVGVVLTIEPGSVVKFMADLNEGNHVNTNRSLEVHGSLFASGAIFTSYFDDAHGGDTNSDADASVPLPGDWALISLNGPAATLDACQISFGGSGLAGSEGQLQLSAGSTAIINSTISDSFTRGVITTFADRPVITGSTITRNGSDGLLSNSVVGTLANNTFSDNNGIAVKIPATLGNGVTNNTYSGNIYNAMYLSGDVDADSNWPASNTTYVLAGNTGLYNPTRTSVAAGATLNVEPGATVKFLAGLSGGIHVNTTHYLQVSGVLNASGSVFTSFFDDSHGGDTDGYGNTVEPLPGDWFEIRFASGSTGGITNSVISFGGGAIDGSMLAIDGSSPSISGSSISDSLGRGIDIYSGDPAINSCSITRSGSDGLNSQASVSNLASNTFTENSDIAVKLPATIGAAVTGNSYSGNGMNAMYLTDHVTVDTTWPASNSPYVLEGVPPNPGAEVMQTKVMQGTTLTVNDLAVVKFKADANGSFHVNTNRTLLVEGALIATGAVFTSFYDDEFGGDADNDPATSGAGPGDWRSIRFEAGSNGSITKSLIRYGGDDSGSGELVISDASPNISETAVMASEYSGIVVYSGEPSIHHNDIYANGPGWYALTYSGTPLLDVTENFWNDTNGPNINSKNRVSGNLDYDPCADVAQTTFGQAAIDKGMDTYAALAGEPVNMATGAFVYEHQDINILTRGVPLAFSRTYNSNDSVHGPLGYGWSYNWQVSVSPMSNGDVSVLREDGRADLFVKNPDNSYRSPAGRYDTLIKNPDQTYTLTTHENVTYQFDANHRLSSLASESGQVTHLAYDGNSRLLTVTEPSGRTLSFTYYMDNVINEITDPDGNTVSFGYTPEGDLATVTDQNGGVTTFTYADHRVISATDPNGHSFVNNVYDPEGRVVSQTDAEANLMTFEYDAALHKATATNHMDPADPSKDHTNIFYHDADGRLVREEDSYGNETSYTYDSMGNQDGVTDRLGISTRQIFDADGNITDVYLAYGRPEQQHTHTVYNVKNHPIAVTNARGYTATFAYDASGSLLTEKTYPSVTNYDGSVSTYSQSFTYNADGLVTSVTDRNGDVTSFSYDVHGYPDQVTKNTNRPQSEQAMIDLDFDLLGRRTALVDGNGHETTFEYDPIGNLRFVRSQVTNPETELPEDLVTEYRYDGAGNRTMVIDPEGKTTSFAYTSMDKLSLITDARLSTIENTYDAVYNRTATKDRNGNWTHFGYDKNDRLVSVIDPEAHESTFTYDAEGNQTAATDPLGQTVTSAFDALGRQISLTEPDEGGALRTTSYTYDRSDNMLSSTDPAGHSYTYAYDALKRLQTATDPLGNNVSYRYDGVGNPVRIRDQRGYETDLSYSPSDLLIGVTDALGGVTGYSYDQNGNRTGQTDANGHSTAYEYDELGRMTSEKVDAGSGSYLLERSYMYNKTGNLTKDTTADGSISFGYDDVYNLTDVTDRQGASYSFTYDANQNQLTATEDATLKTVSSSYNSMGLLTQSTDAHGAIENFSYDDAANLTQRQDSVGAENFTTSYQYTPRSQLKSVTRGAETNGFTFDAAGNIAGKTYANGVATSYSYDAADRLTALQSTMSGQTLQSFTQTYDAAGNITSMDQAGLGSIAYSYDALNRLTSENITGYGAIGYSYDPAGNRTTMSEPTSGLTSYSYNQANQLTQLTSGQNTTGFSYNPTGALTQKTTGAGTTTYAYNGLDKLTEVITPTATASYGYDAQGRRIQRSAGADTTNYHLSPGGDIADYETDATGALKSSYLQGADGLICQTDYTGQTPATSYFLYNPHGDTSALTDENGAITASYRYDSFGNAINSASPTNGYTGKWQRDKDNITGTIRMGAREYDPSLGRFTSIDPLKGSPTDPQQRNRYAYATNNPLTRYDLNGLSVCGPGLRDNIKDAASWTGDAAGQWWDGVQIGWENPSMLWDAAGQFANDFFIEDFKVLFSADASLNERFGAMGFIAMNFVPGGKLGKLGKLAKLGKLGKVAEDVAKAGLVGEDLVRAEKVALAALRAVEAIGPGKGAKYGTEVHMALKAEIEKLGDPRILAEQSYSLREVAKYGKRGSIRVDVAQVDEAGNVTAVYDLKTGNARLSKSRIAQIRKHIIAEDPASVPIVEIKP